MRVFVGEALCCCALDEDGAGFLDVFFFLFGDGLDERVGGAEGDAAEFVDDLHDLFLVDHDAVGFVGEAVDDGVYFGDWCLAVLAPVVVRDEVHGAWSEEGVCGDEVCEAVWFHVQEESAHSSGFELEDAGGVAFLEEFVDSLVVVGESFEVEGVWCVIGWIAVDGFVDVFFGDGFADECFAALDDAECAQTQEVHFEEAHFFACWAVPLGDDFVVLCAGLFVEWADLVEWFCCDDDAGGVYGGVAGLAFEDLTGVDDSFDGWVCVVECFELRFGFECFFECDAEFFWDEFCEFVGFCEWVFEYACYVSDDGACFECSEGDDLRDVAVFSADVVEDVVASVLAEVDIDIGVFCAVGVCESFEEEAVFDGAGVGEAQDVADHCSDA